MSASNDELFSADEQKSDRSDIEIINEVQNNVSPTTANVVDDSDDEISPNISSTAAEFALLPFETELLREILNEDQLYIFGT